MTAVVDAPEPASPRQEELADEDSVDLTALARLVAARRRLVLAVVGLAAAASAMVALLLPNTYTATAVIMPPQQDQSGAGAILGQIVGGASGGAAGIATALGLKNPNDLYVGILRSRTVADRLIGRFQLLEIYGHDTWVETREALEDYTAVTAAKDGLIRIAFEDEDPQRAADVANAYVEELENLTKTLAISDASRRRLYYEQKVKEAQVALAQADTDMRRVQESTGLIKMDEQARAIFEAVASLRGAIAAKEVELAGMRSFATDRNPDYVRQAKALQSMRQQLAGLERTNRLGAGDILVPTGKIPEAGHAYVESLRNVRYFEAVYEQLAKQLELAKVEEGKNATIIQMVDKAVPPDRKSGPKRALIVAGSVLLAFACVVAWIFAEDAWRLARRGSR
jgi:uncharacterized protein involved in exopolysaccharide biosynthesis